MSNRDRLTLQSLLVKLLKNNNVYYQPPASLKMSYPAIRYTKTNIDKVNADDTAYLLNDRYEVIVISRMPDHPVIKELLKLPYCTHNRHYVSDNLNHDVFTLYY